jgi:hypothetical protein
MVSTIKKPRMSYRIKWRWYSLVLISIFIIGGYFCYDNPAELESAIEKEYNIGSLTYSYLYSVYSLPNMILPLFTGMLFARIGLGKALILFTGLVAIGQ